MNSNQLTQLIFQRQSYLCVGLDTDITKLPVCFTGNADAVFEFNKAIIDATRPFCVAYKINTAFYEALGLKGWEAMEKTVQYIGDSHFKIADAKRGDIGNTSHQYAKAFLQNLPFDAVTVAPYMGKDSVQPFLEYEGKWAIVLGLTSNAGAADFELQLLQDGEPLYSSVLKKVAGWGSTANLMFVVGATQANSFIKIRECIPQHFLLVPGVGEQGGSLKDISEVALNKNGGILVNASRAVIYASKENDFAEKAAAVAQQYQHEMAGYLAALG